MNKVLLDVEEDWKLHPWTMMQSIQLFYQKIINSRNLKLNNVVS